MSHHEDLAIANRKVREMEEAIREALKGNDLTTNFWSYPVRAETLKKLAGFLEDK